MTNSRGRLHRGLMAGLLAMAVLPVVFFNTTIAQADGGIAMSGSFYQQDFEIPQGSSVSGPDVYVVVFNNSNDQLKVKMTSTAPSGVRILLSQTDFTLPPSGQQQIQVGIEVGIDAVPGKYEININAEPYKETVTGIQLAGAASQKANLIVVGESAMVSLQAMSPDQQPIVATVRLYRVVSGQEHEVAYKENGFLEIKVAPGSFIAASFIGGIKLAEERFDIAAGETKNIILTGATVFFEGFDIVPNYQKEGGSLAFIQIVYTVTNLYQRVTKGEVFLNVSCNGVPSTQTLLATLSPLEIGRAGLNYNYIPDEGWIEGSYEFKLQLNMDDKPYASSLVKQITVSGSGDTGDGGIKLNVIGGIAAAVVVVAVTTFFLVRMRRRY